LQPAKPIATARYGRTTWCSFRRQTLKEWLLKPWKREISARTRSTIASHD
jgi:hypothetical protein